MLRPRSPPLPLDGEPADPKQPDARSGTGALIGAQRPDMQESGLALQALPTPCLDAEMKRRIAFENEVASPLALHRLVEVRSPRERTCPH